MTEPSGFNCLPPDLRLAIISLLPIQQIHALQLSSRECDFFVRTNETTIYHAAAVLHNFVNLRDHDGAERATSVTLAQAQKETMGAWADGVSSWKEFCPYLCMTSKWLVFTTAHSQANGISS